MGDVAYCMGNSLAHFTGTTQGKQATYHMKRDYREGGSVHGRKPKETVRIPEETHVFHMNK